MSWEAASVIVNSILAFATFVIIVLNYRQVKASKQQADASEDQVREMRRQVEASQQQLRVSRDQLQQSQEQMKQQVRISEEQLQQSQKQIQGTLEAAQRPFVFPTNPPKLAFDGKRSYFDFDQLDPSPQKPDNDEIGLKNGGSGIALNVLGVLVQPRPQDDALLKLKPRQRLMGLDFPQPPGAEAKSDHSAISVPITWDIAVGDDPSNTMAAPSDAIVRLSVFYADIFGQTYVSQFDLYGDYWRFHQFSKMAPGSQFLERLKR